VTFVLIPSRTVAPRVTGGLTASGRHIVDMANNYCSAVNCSNRRKNCPGKSFFRFPKIPARLALFYGNFSAL